jgi:hypothetical protein
MATNSNSSIVRYGSYDEATVDLDAAQVDALSGNVLLSFDVGDTIIRFLPPPVGRNSPFRITAMHYVDPLPGGEKTIVFACPRHELREPCVVCAEAQRLGSSPNPLDRERGKRLQAGLRVYANVVHRVPGWEENPVVRVVSFGKQIHDQLKAIRKNPRVGGDFTNPLELGFDIIVHREGSGKNDTRYTVAADRNSSLLHPDPAVMQQLIDDQPDLEKFVDPIVPEELIAIMGQVRTAAGAGVGSRQAAPSRGAVGADLMQRTAQGAAGGRGAAAKRTVQAVDTAGEELDDDFNPIRR